MKQKYEGLRARRLELGMTLEDVAVKVGVTAAMIRSVEVGGQRGGLVTRAKIAGVLKIPLKHLLSNAEAAAIVGDQELLEKIESLIQKAAESPDPVDRKIAISLRGLKGTLLRSIKVHEKILAQIK